MHVTGKRSWLLPVSFLAAIACGNTPTTTTASDAGGPHVDARVSMHPDADAPYDAAREAGHEAGLMDAKPTDTGGPAAYTYEGCPVFGTKGWFDTDVSSAAPDPNSAAYVKATVDAGDTGGFNLFVPPNERINLATDATPLLTVTPQVSWHTFPFEVPWAPGFYIEPASDAHSMAVQKDTCFLYELYQTTYEGGTLSAYSGAGWDLSKAFDPSEYSGATASGLPLVAMMLKPEELAAGVIGHSLGWGAVGGEGTNTVGMDFVAPARSSGGLVYGGPATDLPMPYGSHIRLQAAFDDSAFPASAKAVTRALKQFGAYLYDTGCCDEIPATDDAFGTFATYWTSSDDTAIAGVHITDFDVIPPSAM
jgi:hypothetical protein